MSSPITTAFLLLSALTLVSCSSTPLKDKSSAYHDIDSDVAIEIYEYCFKTDFSRYINPQDKGEHYLYGKDRSEKHVVISKNHQLINCTYYDWSAAGWHDISTDLKKIFKREKIDVSYSENDYTTRYGTTDWKANMLLGANTRIEIRNSKRIEWFLFIPYVDYHGFTFRVHTKLNDEKIKSLNKVSIANIIKSDYKNTDYKKQKRDAASNYENSLQEQAAIRDERRRKARAKGRRTQREIDRAFGNNSRHQDFGTPGTSSGSYNNRSGSNFHLNKEVTKVPDYNQSNPASKNGSKYNTDYSNMGKKYNKPLTACNESNKWCNESSGKPAKTRKE